MLVSLNNASTGTSPQSRELKGNHKNDVKFIAYGDFGGGSVTLQILSTTGDWIEVSELTFTEPTAQAIELWKGAVVRISAVDCTDVSVEVH